MPILIPGLRILTRLFYGDYQTSIVVMEKIKGTIFVRLNMLLDHSMRVVRLESLKVVT